MAYVHDQNFFELIEEGRLSKRLVDHWEACNPGRPIKTLVDICRTESGAVARWNKNVSLVTPGTMLVALVFLVVATAFQFESFWIVVGMVTIFFSLFITAGLLRPNSPRYFEARRRIDEFSRDLESFSAWLNTPIELLSQAGPEDWRKWADDALTNMALPCQAIAPQNETFRLSHFERFRKSYDAVKKFGFGREGWKPYLDRADAELRKRFGRA